MTGYVVDTSVAVKWLVNEAFSEEAASLLDNRDQCSASIPASASAEPTAATNSRL
jgi:predicted nucleic acid-binding protein